MASQWSDTDSQPPTEPSGVTTAMGSRVVSPTWSPADQFVQDFPEEHQAAVRAQYASNNVVAAAAAPWCALPANFALVTNRVPPRLTKGSVDLSELVNDLCGQGQVTKTDEEALFELLCETDICSEFCDCISFYHAQGAEAPHLVAIRILLHADSVKWKREFGTQRMTDGYSHKDFAEESCEAMEDALKWNPAMGALPALP